MIIFTTLLNEHPVSVVLLNKSLDFDSTYNEISVNTLFLIWTNLGAEKAILILMLEWAYLMGLRLASL